MILECFLLLLYDDDDDDDVDDVDVEGGVRLGGGGVNEKVTDL